MSSSHALADAFFTSGPSSSAVLAACAADVVGPSMHDHHLATAAAKTLASDARRAQLFEEAVPEAEALYAAGLPRGGLDGGLLHVALRDGPGLLQLVTAAHAAKAKLKAYHLANRTRAPQVRRQPR